MNARKIKLIGCLSVMLLSAGVQASDFAVEVVSYSGQFGTGNDHYGDPRSVLGKPTTFIKDGSKTFVCSLVYPPWNVAPDGNELVVTLGIDANIVVGFDHKIADDIGNLYGIDFIVFGNSSFEGIGWLTPNTDMDGYFLKNPASIYPESIGVSVAQHPDGPWYAFSNGPFADANFPTNAFAWDSNSNSWTNELNWLKPLNPALGISDFDGLSAAEAIALYDGSAGGTGFDLKWLDPDDYQALEIDPNSGRRWIQYIKVQCLPDSYDYGEIDAFSDVAAGGDYKHLVGDLDADCGVDYEDLRLFCQYWLTYINGPNDAAVIADLDEDGFVNFYDFSMMFVNWLKFSEECE
jgi:hypothetical protein